MTGAGAEEDGGRRPVLWLLLLNVTHARATERMRAALAARGVETRDLRTAYAMPEAIDAWLAARGRRAALFGPSTARMRRGDVLLTGVDWGAHMEEALPRLRARGVRVAAFVEACRFASPGRYRIADPVLVWGPSGRDAFGARARVVGSPAIEAAARRRWTGGGGALINWKFTFGDEDPGGRWLTEVLSACAAAGLRPVISAHPNTDPSRLPDLLGRLSGPPAAAASARGAMPGPAQGPALAPPDRSFADLAETADVVVSRASTVIHEALAMGAPTVLHAAPDERLEEFARPLGAFRVTRGAAGLARELAALAARRRRPAAGPGPHPEARAFLDLHASREPVPAGLRMADALAALLDRGAPDTPAR